VTAAHILIACGTRPFRPEYVPFDGKSVFDSDEIIDLPKLPRSLAVIGAGVIGVEYATIFSALDVAVTLIEPRPTFLDFIDKELIDEFMHELRDRNVALRLGSAVNDRAQRERQHRDEIRRRPQRHLRDAAVRGGRVGATDRLNLEASPASRSIIAAGSRSIR
jgi:NAD(P) transhydrogenase